MLVREDEQNPSARPPGRGYNIYYHCVHLLVAWLHIRIDSSEVPPVDVEGGPPPCLLGEGNTGINKREQSIDIIQMNGSKFHRIKVPRLFLYMHRGGGTRRGPFRPSGGVQIAERMISRLLSLRDHAGRFLINLGDILPYRGIRIVSVGVGAGNCWAVLGHCIGSSGTAFSRIVVGLWHDL